MITGANRGIGRACATTLAEEGCSLAICARGEEALYKAADEMKEKGVEVFTIQADVTKSEDIKAFAAGTVEAFARIDILVNNAGTGRLSDMLELPMDEFRNNKDLMLYGPIQCCREAIPHMRKQGGGRIINISSVFGKQPGGLIDYDAIKAALIMFTKDLGNYLAKDKITVNAVCPGPIKGSLWEGPGGLGDQLGQALGMSGAKAVEWFAEQNIPMGHHGDPEDIADMVAFLASEKAKFITGQSINVDGGMVKATI